MSQWLFPIFSVVPVQAFSELVPMFMEPGEPTRPRDPGDPGTIAPKVSIGPLALYMAFCGFIRYRWDIHSEDYDGLWDIYI